MFIEIFLQNPLIFLFSFSFYTFKIQIFPYVRSTVSIECSKKSFDYFFPFYIFKIRSFPSCNIYCIYRLFKEISFGIILIIFLFVLEFKFKISNLCSNKVVNEPIHRLKNMSSCYGCIKIL